VKQSVEGPFVPSIEVYDTTLRDGTQGEGFNLSLEDKLAVAAALDSFGVAFIEGGWPGSNPKDARFFDEMKGRPLARARLAAFGSTRRRDLAASDDPNLNALLASGAPVVTVFGKTWGRHAIEALGATLEENLEMVRDSVSLLKGEGRFVIFDAEHAFDGFRADAAYARQVLEAAVAGGADRVVVCDTNGGTLPQEIAQRVSETIAWCPVPVGIHAHNDCELAVANSIAAVQAGARHVQGTINGVGERTGNANLVSVIGVLQTKLGLACVQDLPRLTELSRFIDSRANRTPRQEQPFVGASAFAHKGGVHVSAVNKSPSLYEHLDPETVGNTRRVLVSDLAGRANIVAQAAEYGIGLDGRDPAVARAIDKLKSLEDLGFAFEGADASVQMLLRASRGEPDYFTTESFRVHADLAYSEASVQVRVGEHLEHAASLGDGPVSALDRALRLALERHYPTLRDVELLDYKVRVLEGSHGTSARVRVLIESGDGRNRWGSVGASTNILKASFMALVDSLGFKLVRDGIKPPHEVLAAT
jgi:2-isopropylmalate synthase